MYYDPIKNVFAKIIKRFPLMRVFFYKVLNIMFLRSWYVRRELNRLREKFGDKELNIYDAGSGYGQYTYFMSKHLKPCTIHSVDIKEDWIEDCKDYFESSGIKNVSFGVEDLTKIIYEESFDLVVCVDVMEHIADDITVFSNFYRALKSEGYLLINTPSTFGGSDVHHEEEESFIGEHARDDTYGFWGDKAWRLGIKYPMILLNVSKLFFLLLPFYYLITLPFTFVMMFIDYSSNNKRGSGINFIAKKV
jgi:ubiquinone/menaquinone biosynthesis C-methylase UbiE